ncbi:MAG: alpha/beta hydrolase [Actinobacteria bacterium]|nr:alpha/beta hydrolase [Actinomycetota bacterium]
MSVSARLLAAGTRATGTVAPELSARLALRLFFTTAPRMAVREADRATHDEARRERIRIRGSEVVVYQWGRGERAVLLMHGWQGRASQFAPLVRELVAEGCRVLSFDAPAHGASGGTGTDLRDWVEIAARLQRTDGPFHAIVGHSFGGLAALTAARTTTAAPRVAVIAGAASPAAFLAESARALRLSPDVEARFGRRFAARFRLDPEGITAAYDAVRDPLPAGTELLVVHDRADARMPDADALRLHAAHAGRSRLLRTQGLGHNRVLRADEVLDAVLDLVRSGSAGPDTAARAARDDATPEVLPRR